MSELPDLVPQQRLREMLGLDGEAFGRALAAGRIPKPDVQLSRKRKYWRRDTVARFIGEPATTREKAHVAQG